MTARTAAPGAAASPRPCRNLIESDAAHLLSCIDPRNAAQRPSSQGSQRTSEGVMMVAVSASTTTGSNCVPPPASRPALRLASAGAVRGIRGHRVERPGDGDRSALRAGSLRRGVAPDSRCRPSARGGAAPSSRRARRRGSEHPVSRLRCAAPSPAAPRSTAAPRLRRISRGIASLPRSCSRPARRASSSSSWGSSSCSAMRTASVATRSEWLPVYGVACVDGTRRATTRRGTCVGSNGRRSDAHRARADRRRPRREAHLVLAVLLRP